VTPDATDCSADALDPGDDQVLVATRARAPAAAETPILDGAEIATARRYADASRAASTQRAYASDWRRFAAWSLARGIATLPADPRIIFKRAQYLIN
jgi:hypothetical protein